MPIKPNAIPVSSPMIMTKGDSDSSKVPTEKGTVSPSSIKYASRNASRVPVSVASKLSWISEMSKAPRE